MALTGAVSSSDITPGRFDHAIHRVRMQALCFDHHSKRCAAYTTAFLRRYQEIIETHDWAAELA